jgi:hypothetical protein
MDSIPKELSAPLEFLRKIKLRHISAETTKDGLKAIEDFRIISLVPTWSQLTKYYCEQMTFILKEIIAYKKSDYHFPRQYNEFKVIESGTIEIIDEYGISELVPNMIGYEVVHKTTEDDIALWYREFTIVLNEFINVCKNHGYEIDTILSSEIIDALVYLKINDIDFIDYGSKDNFKLALLGEKTENEMSNLKIEIALTKMEAAYIFSRIKNSTKLPLITKMVDLGAFVKNNSLYFENMRSDLSKFNKDDKKLILKTEIDNKIDEIINLL